MWLDASAGEGRSEKIVERCAAMQNGRPERRLILRMVRQGLPVRGNSQPIICRYGSPLDGIRSIAFLAKGMACSSVCRLSFGSAIHSRMIFRRVSCSGRMLKILCYKWRAPTESPRCAEEGTPNNASGDLLQDANLTRMLASRGFQCFCPCFLACIFGHHLSQLVFDSECRRKLELSSEMMRAHLALLSLPHAGNGVVAVAARINP